MTARIAIIEDNLTNLELMSYLLIKFGYVILTAMDGEEGLALVKKEIPDLVICDIELPKIDGYEIAKNLKKTPKFTNIPLIAVTAYAMVGDKDKIIAAGYDGYIPKPIDPEKFVKQIEEFLKLQKQTHFISSSTEIFQEKKQSLRVRKKGLLRTILVLDDSSDNRQLSKTLLESEGFKVALARNARQALDFLEKETPDLILTDMHMPEMNGIDFCITLRSTNEYQQIPLIFISSSHPTKEELQKCPSSAKVILRPIDPQIFLNTIKEACGLNNKYNKK